MNRRRLIRRTVAPVAVIAGVLAFSALGGGNSTHAVQKVARGWLPIELPAKANAGDLIIAKVAGVPAGDSVALTTMGSLGTTTQTETSTGGVVRFVLPQPATRVAGDLELLASSGARSGTSEVTIVPGQAVNPVLSVVGARHIVADRHDLSMVVAVPTDRFGNAVSNGTPVDVVRQLPNGQLQTSVIRTADLLVWAELTSGTQAGRDMIRVGVGDATGPMKSLDEVAGPPVSVPVSAAGRLPAADGSTLVPIRTGRLVDRYGNVEPDGTLVDFLWDGPSGPSSTSAETIDGVARFWLEAPTAPETLRLWASARGTTMRKAIMLRFGRVNTGFSLQTTRTSAALNVLVGPVLGPAGGFAASGAQVTVSITDAGKHVVRGQAQLDNGIAKISLPSSALSGPLTVRASVLGISRTEVLS
jgi:hypothetical protein